MRTTFSMLLLLSAATFAAAQELPEDLKHVPGNAVGVIHVRTAELWKSPAFKMYRDVLPKAGADVLKMLEERVTPSLATIDRITIVYLTSGRNNNHPKIGVFVHTTAPFDQKALLANLEKVPLSNNGAYYRTQKFDAVQIFGPNTFLIGDNDVPELIVEGGQPPEAFRKGLAMAASGKKMVVGVANTTLLPADAAANAPQPFRPLFRANTVIASLDLGDDIVAEVELGFNDPDHATDAVTALTEFREMGKFHLKQLKEQMRGKLAGADRAPLHDVDKVVEIVGPVFALAGLTRAEEILADIPVKRDNNRVIVTLKLPDELKAYGTSTPILIGLLVPAVQKVRESASRLQEQNNLKFMALSMHAYHDNYKHFPPPAICDKTGKPLLSWRVAVLPYIEQNELYKKFKLDEPWDSAHNKKLLPLMPDVFLRPNYQKPGETETFFRVFVGPGALFSNYSDKVRLQMIRDGTSNTLMIVTAGESVPWTKPDELTYDANTPLPKLGKGPAGAGSSVAFCDGSVQLLSPTIREATLRALITRAGGEVVNFDDR